MDKDQQFTTRYINGRKRVTKSNDLIVNAVYNLTAQEMKLFAYVISKIQLGDAEFQRYTITAGEFAATCGVSVKNIYRDFRRMVDSFDAKKRWIQIGNKEIRFCVFSEAEYDIGEGQITVVLNSRLKAYLLDLKNKFTYYQFWNVIGLNSKYSIRLYEILRSYEFQAVMEIDTEELKEMLNAKNYTVYSNFKNKILDIAVKEISDNTDITVYYETINSASGSSHKVTAIIFHISKKSDEQARKVFWRVIRENNIDMTEEEANKIYDRENDISNDNDFSIINSINVG